MARCLLYWPSILPCAIELPSCLATSLGPAEAVVTLHWKLKAMMQNAIALLPSSASYAAYYWMQRNFGALRQMDPMDRLCYGVEIWKRLRRQGRDPADGVFFEVGTGRVPLVPLAYWLLGANKTITVDLNPYVKDELFVVVPTRSDSYPVLRSVAVR